MRRNVQKVALVLAFAGYAWLTFLSIEEGGVTMWILVVGWLLALPYGWAMGRAEKRHHVQRLALAERLDAADGYPPLVDMDERERDELFDALVDGAGFETLPPKWQSAIREAERNREAQSGSVGEPDPAGPYGFARPPRRAPRFTDPARVQNASIELFFGEVSEEASRFWSKPHPLLLYDIPWAVVVLVGGAGIITGVLLYKELGALVMLVIIVGSLTLAAVVAVWLSRRYEIPLKLPPRPPPDPRNAPDQASFRGYRGLPLLVWLLLPLGVFAILIRILELAGHDPKINAEDASMWLAPGGIVLALVVAAFVRTLRIRIDIDAFGVSVTNFWKTRVIPWESVRAIQIGGPLWGIPVFPLLNVGMAAAGSQGLGDPPSGLRIFFSEGELDSSVSRSISVTATLWCDPQRHRRYQKTLATLVKQLHAHGQTAEDPGTRRVENAPRPDPVAGRQTGPSS